MMTDFKFLGLFAATLVACNDPARCVEYSRTAVADASTSLLIGGTYGDVLATATGSRSGVLTWLESEQYVSGFPPPGQTQITVTLREPTMAWDVGLERQGGGRNERLSCPDLLEAEFEVELQSDDEVLDARVLAPASFQTSNAVTIVVDVTEEDLGMLDWSPFEADASLLLVLSYGMATGAEGSLRLRTGEADDFEGVEMSVELATWTIE